MKSVLRKDPDIGRKIREQRERRGITAIAVAQKVGISGGYICKIERGEVYPSQKDLAKILEVLDLDPTVAAPQVPLGDSYDMVVTAEDLKALQKSEEALRPMTLGLMLRLLTHLHKDACEKKKAS